MNVASRCFEGVREVLRAGLLTLCVATGFASAATAASEGEVITERIVVRGVSLEGNLEQNDSERDVIVYLPASYKTSLAKRYPVIYALHGYSIDNDIWSSEIKTPDSIIKAYGDGAKEMIIVLPDSRTLHNGSMYSSSITTGDWESFIADDLVNYIDANYRTIPTRESRGIAGHSMGGYGALRIGMKRPDRFSALYSMSPCCLSARGAPPKDMLDRLRSLESPQASTELGFFERATMAVASAWAPNPKKPPFYFDLPGDEGLAQSVEVRWAANAPLAMASQYVTSLNRYRAIAIEVGDKDGLRDDAEKMHELLQESGVESTFEVYDGDHVNRVAERFSEHVLPFFSEHLSFE